MNKLTIKVQNKDIIIIDPLYVINGSDNYKDWKACNYGQNMKALGITHYITKEFKGRNYRRAIYDSTTKKQLGRFCVDSGRIGVFELNEVRAYHPNIEWEDNWGSTKIYNFTGEICIEYDKETKNVFVTGKGSINFYTAQIEE